MTEQQEKIVFDYLDQYPHSLTRRQIHFDDDEFMVRIVPLMENALASNKPLTDAIFNMPEDAGY